ncbi:hypothetical protein SBA4_1270008 [Candidatus Sulfopaludibacter sp. SbA4]|nr:hypothetical protein SBA4_1270008 [Candidatus Sulfopaludibacter sp. SbA4]
MWGRRSLGPARRGPGHEVLAVDSSPAAVRSARAKGVDARVVTWPMAAMQSFSQHFDAVVFARSLHHIQPLGQTLDQVRRVLAPGGMVAIEDFAYSELDPATANWFFDVLQLLDASGVFRKSDREFGRRLLRGGGSFLFWHEAQDHEITPAVEMRAAVAQRFEIASEVREPYLYRYAVAMLRATERGVAVAERLYELEKKMADKGLVRLIGRRLVGRKISIPE